MTDHSVSTAATHLIESLLRDMADLQKRLPDLQRAAFDEGVKQAKENSRIETRHEGNGATWSQVLWDDAEISGAREAAYPELPQ